MSIYKKKQQWKWWLAASAMLIVLLSLWYSQQIVHKISNDEKEKIKLWAGAVQKRANLVKSTSELFTEIKNEERKKVELYAEATKELTKDVADLGFSLRVLQDNNTVPVIMTNSQNKIVSFRNLDSTREKDTTYLAAQLAEMRQIYKPIESEYAAGKKNYLYYKNSKIFYQIKLVFDSLIKSFISEVAINSASVPVIYTDSTKHNVLAFGKIDSQLVANSDQLNARLLRMKEQASPIEINLGNGIKNYIFYEESSTLKQLRYFPYVQLLIIALFLLIAYALFSTARNSEQNLVFVGMSKETAHQLGTPLSSLMAWVEYLKETTLDPSVIYEMNRDVDRLQTITDRFSKIGSQPALTHENTFKVLEHALDYLKQRSSKNIKFVLEDNSSNNTEALLCVPLFEWVIENICRNGIDAMDGKGKITVNVKNQNHTIIIDINDTGKGIVNNKLKTVFEPGYTTKQRGWGMGLSLCKRIIENYHSGKIFVKQSEIGKGTTFRIILSV